MHAGSGLQFPGPAPSFPHHSPLPPPGPSSLPAGGCDVAGGTPGLALVHRELPKSRSPGMAGEVPLWPSSLEAPLGV